MKKINILIATALLATTAAQAYSLTATFILNKVVKNHEHIKVLEVEGKITDLRNHNTFREVTHLDFSSGKIHSVFMDDAGAVIGDKTFRLLEAHALGLAWYGLAYDSNENQVQAILSKLGITAKDDSTVGLTRLRGRPVFEMGTDNSLKIEKDLFVFAGYQSSPQDQVEVESFTSGSAYQFPKVLHFKKDGNEIFTYEFKSFKANMPAPKNPKTPVSPRIGDSSPMIQGWIDLVH